MSPTASLLLPLVAALGYAFAALMLKRGTDGAGPWRVNFMSNWVQAAIFSLLWFLPAEHAASFRNVSHALIAGSIFFVGQVFTFLALSRGDVSVATPVLGAKVIFVALYSAALGTEKIGPSMWLAVLLTAGATALLGSGGPHTQRDAVVRSILYGLTAAAFYAATDIVQLLWVREWGITHYLPTMFYAVSALSLTLLPVILRDRREVSGASWRWMVGGSAVLGCQAGGVTLSIITIGATATNVLYNSRGLWSVMLVWTIGHWFGNAERGHGRAVMLRRFCGSLLLLAAIVLMTHR